MAFTGAEKQARHRERVKVRLASAALVETFRAQVRKQIENAGEDPTCPETATKHVTGMLGDPDRTSATVRAFLAQAVGVPGVQARGAGTGGVGGDEPCRLAS